MKTLVIGPNDNPPVMGKYTSGLDRVAQTHAAKEDHWLLTTEGDDIHPRQVKLGKARIFATHPKGAGGNWRQVFNWFVDNHHRFDRFIFHGDNIVPIKGIVAAVRAADTEVWCHTPHCYTLWGVGFNSGAGLAKRHGAKVIAVSERLAAIWNSWHRYQLELIAGGRTTGRDDRFGEHLFHDPFIDGVRSPLSSTYRGPVLPATLPGIVLSRMSAEKKIERAFGNGLNLVLATTSRGYRPDLSGESHSLDLPYEDCMSVLAESAFLVSTWEDETYGLNALEAAERGVPVILCEDPTINKRWGFLPHASRTFLPDWGYITCHPSPEGVRDAIARIPAEWHTLEFRQRLASYVRTHT